MAAAKTTPCRILSACKLDGVGYAPNQVVEFPTVMLGPLKEHGLVDPNKASVEYCLKELGAVAVVHSAAEESDQA
ncbi:hypothetical protein [Pseudomonas anguilliseptica]|uniref:Uncharacterized protein n=1 Tax=Pseudomonas anguilliseptica TaxID=53406 RepID=A0A1H4UXL9_PSEAG|nr:hypothetical protein [Pseudomonas anguilliseptica]SEC73622.1 hypothetical protein SAMN05421553_1357 [Pseudomonas anguilliseptica]